MYAFNKRFRPNEFKGLLVTTWLLGALGLLLIAFSIMAFFSAKNIFAAVLLILMGGIFVYFAFKTQSNKSRIRLSSSEFIGKMSDVKSKVIYK